MSSTNETWETVTVLAAEGEIRYQIAPEGYDPDTPFPFQPNGRYPTGAVALTITSAGSVWIGTGKSGLFHYKLPVDTPGLNEAIADFLRYEQVYSRVPILFGLEAIGGRARIANALACTPPANVVRPSDPRYFVHSTSLAAGSQIRRDGAIKSWHVLEQEGNPPQWHKL